MSSARARAAHDRPDPAATRSGPARGALLVDRELAALGGSVLRAAPGEPALDSAQIQPTSVDLRLGAVAHRVRAGFLPDRGTIEERLAALSLGALTLEGDGAVLERGLVYLVPLAEELALSPDLAARFNPRSSTGRCDVFVRVLAPGHPRFDEAPPGWRGRPWLEIAPLSFPVRLRRGDRLAQVRLARGDAALTTGELRELYREMPLCFDGGSDCGGAGAPRAVPLADVRFDEDGGILLAVGFAGRDPVGWRAAAHTDVLELAREGEHDPREFWEAVHAPHGRCILAPGSFYLFASQRRLRVPPTLAAEMLPVDLGLGELRNNYAGFFDSGFGWREDAEGTPLPGGTPAVLEVRAHDVPFLVEDGQVLFRLRFFRASSRPDRLYGEGRGSASYVDQELTLARAFRR